MRAALGAVFWVSAGLLVYTQVGYALALALVSRRGIVPDEPAGTPRDALPTASLVIAAHDEERVIAGKIADARALRYPHGRLEVVVSCDGCSDATAPRAREAGADVVLELPRAGKIRAQDAGVQGTRGEVVAFSDANSRWEPEALERLLAAFSDSRVGYACGRVSFEGDGTNQEGLYWRYEMWLRERESRLASITAGNGAIYAVRRSAYLVVDPVMGHDLSLPFNLVKRGWRAVYVPDARARERMVPTLEGEFRRKRRMMSHTWPILARGGLLSPRGYGLRYAWMILSHRVLRYASPALHVLALLCAAILAPASTLYGVALGAQLAVLVAAALPVRWRAVLVARYYVLTTASVAAGLWDWLAHGTDAWWEAAEGTR